MLKRFSPQTLRVEKSFLQDLLIALSAANLIFFKQWSDLSLFSQTVTQREWLYEKVSASLATYLAISFDVGVIALFFFVALRLSRRVGNAAWAGVHIALALSLFFFFNGVRLSMRLGYLTSTLGNLVCATLLVVTLVTCLIFAWRNPERSISLVRAFIVIFAPFVLVTFSYSVTGAMKRLKSREPRIVSNAHPRRAHRPKLIWWLFDETDYRITFVDRPKDLKLPELDRLNDESFSASNAYPPGRYTSVSIPSYFSGRHVTEPIFVDADTVKATFDGAKTAEIWRATSNLFGELSTLGAKSTAIGWYLPYCRMLYATECLRFPHYNYFKRPYSEDFSTSALNFIEELTYLRPNRAMFHIQTYEGIRNAALAALKRDDLDFTFVHWPAPHAPWIFDRKTMQLTDANAKGVEGYFDNLALMDATLGRLRKEMEAEGIWDRSTILLTSDHGWNSVKDYDGKKDYRIPYLLKFAGQHERFNYANSFDALLTKDLWKAIWNEQVKDAQGAAAWIDARRETPTFSP